jgi:replicative DNA helicase
LTNISDSGTILFKSLLNTNIYNKYISYIDLNTIKQQNPLLYKLYLSLEQLKQKSPKEHHSVEELVLVFNTNYPVLGKDDKALLPQIIARLNAADETLDEAVVVEYLDSLRERQLAETLAVKALDYSQGRVQRDELEKLCQEIFLPSCKTSQEALYLNCDLGIAVEEYMGTPGVRWRLSALNQALGSLRKGNFGFIFARPETGKTTFLASEVTHMAQQIEGTVLWVNNEESAQQIMFRCHQAALGKSKDWILSNLQDAKDEYKALIGDRLKIVDTQNANKKTIEAICKDLKPNIIVFDQLDKIVGFEAERYDLLQKAKYQWARELSKVYGPVIGVCQAGGSAENKQWLDLNDVDSSHTAKQGEADWMIGIGARENQEFERYLSICKNKLPGDPDTNPDLRHAKMTVGINPFIARYEG